MQNYIRQHSVQALERDFHLQDRKYAIAYYQCPHKAGNSLHKFWNNILWSILTNRTVLYKYWNKDICETYRLLQCKETNTENDCHNLLERAPWMASYDEWKDRIQQQYGRQASEPFRIPQHATMGDYVTEQSHAIRPTHYEHDYGVDLADKYPHKVVMFPICYTKFWQLGTVALQRELLKTKRARATAAQLFSLGPEFLYGMLHRYTFQFAEAVRAAVPSSLQQHEQTNKNRNNQLYTIGLHSRHRFQGLDGCNIKRETNCLNRLIQRRQDKSSSVQVRIMSDRPCTISRISKWLQDRNHSILAVQHKAPTFDAIAEHGPYTGIGYFQDLALVSTSRSAVVGMSRSSSDLLRELVVFQRAMELWETGVDLATMHQSFIDSCQLPYQADPALEMTGGDGIIDARSS